MAFIPKPQEIYRHFKGNLYQVTAVAEHTETGELLVIYQALYGDFKIYARPLSMFTSRVDREKYPDVEQEFRFELQGAEADRQIRESEASVGIGENRADRGTETEKRTEIARGIEAGNGLEAGKETETAKSSEGEGEELNLDPFVLEFLDADTYEQRLNILAGLHHRITEDMLTTMAIACDVELNEGDVEEKYEALKNCLLTLEKYECNRMR